MALWCLIHNYSRKSLPCVSSYEIACFSSGFHLLLSPFQFLSLLFAVAAASHATVSKYGHLRKTLGFSHLNLSLVTSIFWCFSGQACGYPAKRLLLMCTHAVSVSLFVCLFVLSVSGEVSEARSTSTEAGSLQVT